MQHSLFCILLRVPSLLFAFLFSLERSCVLIMRPCDQIPTVQPVVLQSLQQLTVAHAPLVLMLVLVLVMALALAILVHILYIIYIY